MRQDLARTDLPKDFLYFRSHSETYRKYLEKDNRLTTIPCGKEGYGWLKNVLRLFQIAKFERTGSAPLAEDIRKSGFRRGLVLWIPSHAADIPRGWRRFFLPGSHMTSTGFAKVEPEYWKKWNERAARARKKFLANAALSVREVPPDEFEKAFLATRVGHMFKRDFARFFRRMCDTDPSSMRSFLAFRETKPVAGLAVHDFGNISVHIAAFTSQEAKPLQAGTGLMDHWFQTSLARGAKYLHFDHLRSRHMTRDQQGYSDFKKNFSDYLVEFKDIYFQIQ